MAKRRIAEKVYITAGEIPHRDDPPSLAALAIAVPSIIHKLDTSIIKQHQEKPDWSLYRFEIRDGNPFVIRDMCDRCGKVFIPMPWRKIRSASLEPPIGRVYVESGVCKSCINASIYRDSFLDGEPLTFEEAGKLFYEYATEYERNWRMVLAAAPTLMITEKEWRNACKFFGGCAFCGGQIEVRAMYFPALLNGKHTPWNVIPLCAECKKSHNFGRKDATKTVKRYRVFSTPLAFNRQKTTRLYLLQQMREHAIYMDPLLPFIKRFREGKILEGSEQSE